MKPISLLGSGRRAATLLVIAAALSGCSVLDPRPDSSRYFVLRSQAVAGDGPALDDLVLGVGPVTIPDYMDRNEMLDLVGRYELSFSATHRWAESLGQQVRRTLQENLDVMLRPDAVVAYPWFEREGVGLQVDVTFDPIRVDDEGTWRGSATWVLRDGVTRAPLERNTMTFDLGRDAIPPEQVASGWSTELERLATEIAAAVRGHHPRSP
jgi:uncharacterized lipoprotein YmbA